MTRRNWRQLTIIQGAAFSILHDEANLSSEDMVRNAHSAGDGDKHGTQGSHEHASDLKRTLNPQEMKHKFKCVKAIGGNPDWSKQQDDAQLKQMGPIQVVL